MRAAPAKGTRGGSSHSPRRSQQRCVGLCRLLFARLPWDPVRHSAAAPRLQ